MGLAQVLKKRLSLVEPTVRTDAGFEYEEGEGLDEDEVAANAAKLPVALSQLHGGGLGHGVTAHVEDQVQEFKVLMEITHKVRPWLLSLSNSWQDFLHSHACRSALEMRISAGRAVLLRGDDMDAMQCEPYIVTSSERAVERL